MAYTWSKIIKIPAQQGQLEKGFKIKCQGKDDKYTYIQILFNLLDITFQNILGFRTYKVMV